MGYYMNEICGKCGLPFGSHHAGSPPPWPHNYCPGHEGRMDWSKGPGTTFQPTGRYKEVTDGEPNILR